MGFMSIYYLIKQADKHKEYSCSHINTKIEDLGDEIVLTLTEVFFVNSTSPEKGIEQVGSSSIYLYLNRENTVQDTLIEGVFKCLQDEITIGTKIFV